MLMKTGLTSSAMHTMISTKAIGCSVGLNIWKTFARHQVAAGEVLLAMLPRTRPSTMAALLRWQARTTSPRIPASTMILNARRGHLVAIGADEREHHDDRAEIGIWNGQNLREHLCNRHRDDDHQDVRDDHGHEGREGRSAGSSAAAAQLDALERQRGHHHRRGVAARIPRDSSGTIAPPVAALFAVSEAAMPSMMPVPNFFRMLEIFVSIVCST